MLSTMEKFHIINKYSQEDPNFIFSEPNEELIYTKNELEELLEKIIGKEIPQQLANVPQSQYAKKLVLKALGYNTEGIKLRSKIAKANMPRFVHQKIDIFKQRSRNMQIWSYSPYSSHRIDTTYESLKNTSFSEFNYIIICHDNKGIIQNIVVKNGSELEEWDNSKLKTLKLQATVSNKLRKNIINKIINGESDLTFEEISNYKLNTVQKKQLLYELDDNISDPLIKKYPEKRKLLYSISEIKELISPLIGRKISVNNIESTRILGQAVEKVIAEFLGYRNTLQTDTGEFPDLLNQLIEVKVQSSPTIDLGKISPESSVKLQFDNNKWNIAPKHIRYVIVLTTYLKDVNMYTIDSIVITEGREFFEFFTIVNRKNWKVQLTIPQNEYNR